MLLTTLKYIFGISNMFISILFLLLCIFAFNKLNYLWLGKVNYILCQFITELNDSYMHHRTLVPLLYSVFLIVFILNVAGIFGLPVLLASPIVMITLVACVFLIGLIYGIYKRGVLGFLKGLVPHGVPVFITPLLLVIELVALLIKPVVLCARLLLTIAVGHVTIDTFTRLTSWSIFLKPLLVPLLMIDIAKAFLYAYLFTMFSAAMLGKCTEDH